MSGLLLHAEEGLILMVIGMGVVFSFLVLLVFAMGIMSKVVGYLNTIYPEVIPETKASKKVATNKLDECVVAAIAAAISRKRA